MEKTNKTAFNTTPKYNNTIQNTTLSSSPTYMHVVYIVNPE